MTLRRLLTLLSFGLLWSLGAEARAADGVSPPTSNGATASGARERLSFAVVIGNNKSLGKRRPELHYADDDAARYFEILQTMAPGRVWLLSAFDRDSERLFPEAHRHASAPTVKNVEAVGRKLGEQVRAARAQGHETELYFIFAGHGDVAEGEGFVEMADARFRSRDLRAWLLSIPFTRGHVILDSCNSFFMLGVRKPGGRRFATSEDAQRAMAERLSNVGVFLSTSAEGEAFEWSEIQSGIFSHVVRSGLLGAADANADGSVSYLELAAFVDTATRDVRNPNMRPHVFARGPGARDHTPIARLQSMTGVRRLELGDAGSLRLRLRDGNGLALLDAHTERPSRLIVALPEAWARGAVIERRQAPAAAGVAPTLHALPEAPGVVTLAALTDVSAQSRVRGPDETFQTLFAQPFGPRALESYTTERGKQPPRVYGVSREDTERMGLVLDELARAESGLRVSESIGGIGFGGLLTGAGIGVLHIDPKLSKGEKTEARVLGVSLVSLGGLFVIGGTGALLAPSKGEEARDEFRQLIQAGGDPAQAFAAADKRIQEIALARRYEKIAGAFIGSLTMLGCATGFVVSEVLADGSSGRMAPRLGWGGGFVGGGLMLGDALLVRSHTDILSKIWRDDPSLNQYQPSISLSTDGAFLSLSGSL
ncbi:MAG TPA: hypothetical protein VJN18_20000 [Polyangiaceae bacterium]|nr:hypothetical protein [Polyangiaceae bacterium]